MIKIIIESVIIIKVVIFLLFFFYLERMDVNIKGIDLIFLFFYF